LIQFWIPNEKIWFDSIIFAKKHLNKYLIFYNFKFTILIQIDLDLNISITTNCLYAIYSTAGEYCLLAGCNKQPTRGTKIFYMLWTPICLMQGRCISLRISLSIKIWPPNKIILYNINIIIIIILWRRFGIWLYFLIFPLIKEGSNYLTLFTVGNWKFISYRSFMLIFTKI
jgi:hypothetical protein